MCFVHVLLDGLRTAERGGKVQIVLEGYHLLKSAPGNGEPHGPE